MYSTILNLMLLAPLVLALPTTQKPKRSTYADVSISLPDTLTSKWFDPYTSTTGRKFPSDPDSVYFCDSAEMSKMPPKKKWQSFENMWKINAPIIKQKNGHDKYTEFIKSAIQDVSKASKVDARLILAIVMQESTGGADVACTDFGTGQNRDCGLMQFRGGSGFNAADPKGSIRQMITDGVYGADAKPGFLHYFKGGADDLGWIKPEFWGHPFAAAHLYNGGAISGTKLNVPESGNKVTIHYAHDIASRLMGWNGKHAGCLISAGVGESSKAKKCAKMALRTAEDCK